jgi:hypothetical protein
LNGRFSGKVVEWLVYYREIKPKLPRDSHGRYVKKKQPEIVFGKGNYKYMVKFWIEGRKKPEVIGIDSEKDMYAPPGSFNRRAIYARIREIIEKSDKKVRRLRLLTTFDMGTGHRVVW